jgi:hypothetical protein
VHIALPDRQRSQISRLTCGEAMARYEPDSLQESCSRTGHLELREPGEGRELDAEEAKCLGAASGSFVSDPRAIAMRLCDAGS